MDKKKGIQLVLFGGICCIVLFVMIVPQTVDKSLTKSIQSSYLPNSEDSQSDIITDDYFIKIKEEDNADKSVSSVAMKQDQRSVTYDDDRTHKDRAYLNPSAGGQATVLGQLRLSQRTIPVTTQVKARLLEPLSNQDYSQTVHAVIEDNVVVHGETLMLKDAHVTGQFYAIKNHNKMYITFDRLIVNGHAIDIDAVAFDLNSERGLEAEIDERAGQRLIEGVIKSAGVLLASMSQNPIVSSVAGNATELSLKTIETSRLMRVNKQYFYLFFDDMTVMEGV